MWALEVECLAEAIEFVLLGAPGGSRGTRGLGFERPVHPFMAAVLLGFPRFNELWQDAQAHPPRGELDRRARVVVAKGTPLSYGYAWANPTL